jgi:hypothetical protein
MQKKRMDLKGSSTEFTLGIKSENAGCRRRRIYISQLEILASAKPKKRLASQNGGHGRVMPLKSMPTPETSHSAGRKPLLQAETLTLAHKAEFTGYHKLHSSQHGMECDSYRVVNFKRGTR